MSIDELKYLEDILMAIEELEKFIGVDKRFEVFKTSQLLQRAVEREFEIIGEAIKNFKNLNKEIEIKNTKEIIGLRNRIAHAYDSVDYEYLWGIIINHVPKLKQEVASLINNAK